MKRKEKIVILVLLAILAILIIAKVCKNNEKENASDKSTNVTESIASGDVTVEDNTDEEQPNVSNLEDGTKLNTSNKLLEEKKFDGMDLTDIQLTEKDGVTYLLATLTNNTSEVKGGYLVNVIFYDELGNKIKTVDGIIPEIQAGESIQFNTNGTFSAINAYDFELEKK